MSTLLWENLKVILFMVNNIPIDGKRHIYTALYVRNWSTLLRLFTSCFLWQPTGYIALTEISSEHSGLVIISGHDLKVLSFRRNRWNIERYFAKIVKNDKSEICLGINKNCGWYKNKINRKHWSLSIILTYKEFGFYRKLYCTVNQSSAVMKH